MKTKKNKAMMQGAVVLSLAAFVAKILSAVYRVPFQNLVGNAGFYVYQQVYPFYGIGMTFALSGFPVFVSTVIARYQGSKQVKTILWRSFVIAGFVGLGCFVGLRLGASSIAHLMGDAGLEPVIRMVAWMFLTMPFLVVLRGYFQGTFRMVPTAISQVAEQVIRVMVILLVAFQYRQWEMTLYQMGTWAMSSATIAALMALGVLMVYGVRNQIINEITSPDLVTLSNADNDLSWLCFLKRFLLEGGTICLLSSLLVFYQLIDSFTVYKGLIAQGLLAEMAKDLKGIYDRGQPLVQLGMVVGVGFSASYMPLLTRAFAKGDQLEFRRSVESLLKMTLAFALVATVGMVMILPQLNHMLFGSTEGTVVLAVYVVSVLLASMIMAYHGILQSMGLYRTTLIALGIGLLVKWGLTSFLVLTNATLGASIATVSGLLVMVGLLYYATPIDSQSVLLKNHFLAKLVGISLILGGIVSVTNLVIQRIVPAGQTRLLDSLVVFVLVLEGSLIFVGLALKVQLFTKREWVMIPKGKTLLRMTNRFVK